ncbi:MAG: hypothetical protein MJ086_07165 [Lachnospiraceae bacterium]|nr:hypothetical protein [Lachnospiraceae bacterium]
MSFFEMSYISRALLREVHVKVILPTDKMAGNWEPPFRTLYMLPGYTATAMQLITYLGLRGEAELKGMAIVLPDGENFFYQDVPGQMTLYSTFVGKELVEETRNTFPLSRKREDTFIGGISLGGYGALYNGLKYRDTFSKVALFSPSVDPYDLTHRGIPSFSEEQFDRFFGGKEAYENSEANAVKQWVTVPEEGRPELFMCCGTDDGLVYPEVKPFEDSLVAAGVKHVYREGPGNHEMYFWQTMLDPAFSFLAGIEEGTKDKLVAPF